MTKMAKVLLVAAIVCLVLGGALNIGWINPHGIDALYILLPSGAVFFGLFLIVRVLQKEHEVDSRGESGKAEGPKARSEADVKPETRNPKSEIETPNAAAGPH